MAEPRTQKTQSGRESGDVSLRRRIFTIIQIGRADDTLSRVFDFFIVAVIVANIAVLFLGTFSELSRFQELFEVIELVTVLIFIIEYALRIWTADYLFPGASRGKAVLKFLLSFDGIVDLMTILPFFFLSGFVAFRMLRVVRIFRLFRINSYYDSFNVIRSVLYEKRNQIMSSMFIIAVLMLAASLFMYSAEHEAQPESFRNAFSGIWWSVSALLTVGYGDIYPVTFAGRAMAIVISFLGVGAVAIPTGIISAGFVEQYTDASKETPHDLGSLLQTVVIDIDSRWIGLGVSEVEDAYGVLIVMVRRREKAERPDLDYRVMVGDALAVYKK